MKFGTKLILALAAMLLLAVFVEAGSTFFDRTDFEYIDVDTAVGTSKISITNNENMKAIGILQNGNESALGFLHNSAITKAAVYLGDLGVSPYTNHTVTLLYSNDTHRSSGVFTRNVESSKTGQPVITMQQNHALDDQPTLYLSQAGANQALEVYKTHNGTEGAAIITDDSEGAFLNFAEFAKGYNHITASFYRNMDSITTGDDMVRIYNDHASDDQETLWVRQDGTGNGIDVIMNNNLSTNGVSIRDADAGAQSFISLFRNRGYTSNLIWAKRDRPDYNTDSPVIYFQQDHVDDDQEVLRVRQDATTGNTKIQTWYSGATERGWIDIDGDLDVDGTISKGGGGFLIDHPLDPANKLLQHSFVESPEMRNAYYGQDTTSGGKVTITLPSWWQALNGYNKSEYNYQLTAIGARCDLWISQEINNNQFEVSSDKDCKFSWQVTAIRHDLWAEDNRLWVEKDKVEEDMTIEYEEKEIEEGNYINTYKVPKMPIVTSRRKGACVHSQACVNVSAQDLIDYPDIPDNQLIKSENNNNHVIPTATIIKHHDNGEMTI